MGKICLWIHRSNAWVPKRKPKIQRRGRKIILQLEQIPSLKMRTLKTSKGIPYCERNGGFVMYYCYLPDCAAFYRRNYCGRHQLIWGLSRKVRKFKSWKRCITPIQRSTCIPNSIYYNGSERKKLIGCHFVLPFHKLPNNFNYTVMIQGNINND